jgi:hypothetical protein
MIDRLIALGASVLSRLGFLRHRVLAVMPAMPAPAPSPCPPGPRVTRYASLLGSPGCNREGGAP